MKRGDSLGISEWIKIVQQDITTFGKLTKDLEPMHADPEWCKDNSPYKVPIAYGFQTIGLLTYLMNNATHHRFMGHEGTSNFPLNYGFNHLRLITPVLEGAYIRGNFVLKDIQEKRPGESLMTVNVTVEIKNQERPALIAEWLLLWVTGEGTEHVNRVLKENKERDA